MNIFKIPNPPITGAKNFTMGEVDWGNIFSSDNLDKYLGTGNKGLDLFDRIMGKTPSSPTPQQMPSGMTTGMKITIGVVVAGLGYLVLKSFKRKR